MKHLLAMLLAVVFCSMAWGANIGGNESMGDDLVPWPWGTECSFPWGDIEGAWHVRGHDKSTYGGHKLVLESAENVRAGVKLLYIYHYNEEGKAVGQGTGFGDKDNKLIKAIMTNSTGRGRGYEIIVRAYSKEMGPENLSCVNGKTALAVTFCPRNGKICLETSNYLLER